MQRSNDNKFVLVTRKTRMQELIERFNTWPQAKFYLEHNQVDAADYLDEHDLYMHRVKLAESQLRSLGPFQMLERRFLPSYQFAPTDIVVVLGQDGLVANTLKYLQGQPLIGVNPDPGRWDGKLLPFQIDDLETVVSDTVSGHATMSIVTLAKATTNLGQQMLAVNDFFIGPKTHASARYKLQWQDSQEVQSSSGIIVSTGFGSTGWFQSILAGALGVVGRASHPMSQGFDWDARKLQFAVREPFPSLTTGTSIVFGEITAKTTLRLESHMPENGVIFSDGIQSDAIPFNSGCTVEIGLSEVYGNLVV